eukprot:14437061-Ditylum_brightwellii.AAC.2
MTSSGLCISTTDEMTFPHKINGVVAIIRGAFLRNIVTGKMGLNIKATNHLTNIDGVCQSIQLLQEKLGDVSEELRVVYGNFDKLNIKVGA